MKNNLFPVAGITALTAVLAFSGWKIYCYFIEKRFDADRKLLLKKMFVLKQNTDALIKKLHDYGVKQNAFHKELISGIKLTSCLNQLYKIRDEIVIDKIRQIKNVCSEDEAKNILAHINTQTVKNMEVEKALLNYLD